jgi:hypothetical protein
MDSIKVRKDVRESKVKRQKGINKKSHSEFLQNGISKINPRKKTTGFSF